MAEEYKHLGTGWAFPPNFRKTISDVEMTSGVEDIEGSLRCLLGTIPGERVMQAKFGCNLENLLFEPLNATVKTLAIDTIRNAIIYHEPRITPNFIDIVEDTDNDGILMIMIDYTVRTTNSRNNFVYPFYKNEGTEI